MGYGALSLSQFLPRHALHHAVLRWFLPIGSYRVTDEGLHVAEFSVTSLARWTLSSGA